LFDIKLQLPGDVMSEETMIVQSDRMHLVAKALRTELRRTILKLLSKGELDITQLSKNLDKSLAGIHEQIKILEEAGLITSQYKPGKHGIRKICRTSIKHVVFNLR